MDDLLAQIASGRLSVVSVIVWLGLAMLLGAAGGAIGGIAVGGSALGRELAAMMGAFYGVVAAVPGIALALLLLAVL